MGLPIARRILQAGHELTVWNRTPGKAETLAGATIAATPYDAAARTVLTVLPDLPQVVEVLSGETGLLAGWRDAGIEHPTLVIHGTVSPDAVVELGVRLEAEYGVHVVDAPMSGGTIGAAEGRLSLMIGGDEALVDSLRPLFSSFATTIARLGGPGSGAVAKVCNQIVVASTVTAVAEAVNLARRRGLDIEVLLEVLGGGLAASEVLTQKGRAYLTEEFTGGGSAVNQLKDLRFAAETGATVSAALPITRTLTELFDAMIGQGDGALDHTGIYRTIAAASGTEHGA
jgi:2-hydroxy-3-oxopropionate reductase